MKKTAITLIALLAFASTAFAANQVRVSQVYGGGGSSSGYYTNDYVEIFNSGATPVNIGGWTIEYGSATGNWGSSAGNIFTFPVGTTIQPCSYILVQLGSAGSGGVALPVTPDFSNTTTNLSATSGKIGLFNAVNTNLPCGSEIGGTLVDKVAYGTANCAEVAAASGTTNQDGVVRNNGGMTDTDNNANDFTLVTGPTPRNSQSPVNPVCQATPSMRNTWGQVKTLYR